MTKRLVLAVFFVCAAAAPSTTWAAPKKAATDAQKKRARAHFEKGRKLYKQARYKEAIAAFEAAYEAQAHGVIQYNIAQAYEKLGDIPRALRAYHEYLRQIPDAEDRATVELAMKNLEKRLVEKGVQQLLVYSEPPFATVFVDGSEVGKTPYSGEFALGAHTVGVEVAGYQLKERNVNLTADGSLVLDFTLEQRTETVPLVTVEEGTPKDAPVEPPPVLKQPSDEVVKTDPLTPPPGVEQGPQVEPSRGRVWTWVALGAAAAAAGAGGYFGMTAQGQAEELRARPHPRPEVDDLRNGAQSNALTANVLYGVAGAAGGAALALFFVEGSF